jgi:hypothetical protein
LIFLAILNSGKIGPIVRPLVAKKTFLYSCKKYILQVPQCKHNHSDKKLDRNFMESNKKNLPIVYLIISGTVLFNDLMAFFISDDD